MVTPAQPSRRFLAPGDKLGKHEVIRQIAVGGMAELYLTRTVGLEGFEKLVCVKRILPQYINNPSFVNMFLNEARLAATLHHPNIAQVYDIGQELGEFFFSMEYVHGEDLGRLVTTGRESGVPISLDCALTLVAGLCAGLHHAHEKAGPDGKPLGVVHRDVSPTNVLVSYDGAVKLVDFGIARAGGEPSSSQTGLKGKISYMSPEQCRGRVALDRRSDVFSVGTILYELTTGRLPFTDETEYGVLHQIVNRDADPPSALVPGYPPALEAVVMRALARDPARRFSTALELQNQLEDYAHENRLRVSPLVLARLMSTLFPARLEEWDHARAQGAFFVEQHVVRTLIESGKTADGSPHYLPQPLPPVDDASGGVVDDPASASTSADIDAMERTLLGPRPRMSTPLMPTARVVSRPSQPRMPTPQPTSTPTPPPGGVSPASTGRSSRPAPVPNMPGAVPIMIPLPAPPIPSGGTLVSSATQAGIPPPAVMPHQGPYAGPGGYAGSSGQTAPAGHAGLSGQTAPGGYAGRSGQPVPDGYAGYPTVPPARGSFSDTGATGGYGGQGGLGYPGRSAPGGPGMQHPGFGAWPPHDAAPNDVGDVTDRVRVPAARPTLIVRQQRRSRLPVAALAVVCVAGAAVGVWLALEADEGPAAPAAAQQINGAPAGAIPAVTKPEPTEATRPEPKEVARPEPTPASKPEPTTKAEPTEVARPEPTAAARPEPTAPPPAEPALAPPVKVADPTAEPPAQPVPPTEASGDIKPDPTKRKPTKVVLQEPRTKPAKPRVRVEPKRVEPKRVDPKRGQKEQTWNADSPFMPVATPKR